MMNFKCIEDLVQQSEQKKLPIYELILQYESEKSQMERADIMAAMKKNWQVMKASAEKGIANQEKSNSGLVGGDAKKVSEYLEQGYMGKNVLKAVAYAIGISEVNAIMGKIVACPTAGSCGILPAAILAVAEQKNFTEEQILNALFTAAGIGMVIAQNASISGAEGGCQAECGSAAAMAAAALVELAGGSPEQVAQSVALALKNLLGLVCDPVAGLVEVPCVKRNGFASIYAMLAADMAMAGVKSMIPVDEVIDAMYQIGNALPKSLRETAEAGLAASPTARRLENTLYGKIES